MPVSQQFVTFQCAAYHMALPADAIRHLTFAEKKDAILTQKEFSIGSFRSGEEILPGVELFDTAEPGQRVPLIRIDTPEGLLAVRATQILDLHRTARLQPLPLYTDDGIAACFPLGFRWKQRTYHVLDEQALLKLAPQALLKAADADQELTTRERSIPVQQKYWLSYQLSLILNEKISGRIELETRENRACLGFTAGHLTYARSDQKAGRDALRAIAAEKNWQKAQWHDDEIDADHNIADNLLDLIADSNPIHAQ